MSNLIRWHLILILFLSRFFCFSESLLYSFTSDETDPLKISIKKNIFKYYISDIAFNKLRLGYERKLNEKYSIEINGFYKYPGIKRISNSWRNLFIRHSEGGEASVVLFRNQSSNDFFYSLGYGISYRENRIRSTMVYNKYSKYGHVGRYSLTQKRKGLGIFLNGRLRLNDLPNLELHLVTGLYLATSKTDYHGLEYLTNNTYTVIANPDNNDKPTAWFMNDGIIILPNFGMSFSLLIKQPQKGWYKSITQAREKDNYKRKHMLLFPLTELLDHNVGITYCYVNFKNAYTIRNTALFGYDNVANISNGMLVEHNRNYKLVKKNIDLLNGIAYNFSVYQDNYFYLGSSIRGANFNGRYKNEAFNLNKYYLLGDVGLFVRGINGLTMNLNISSGYFWNHYLKNDIRNILKTDGVYTMPNAQNRGLAFNFLFQMGYSFK